MKARMKLAIGAAFAAVAVMAATQPVPTSTTEKQSICYSETEVDLLMRANHWTKQEATTILDMACEFSNRSNLK